MAQELLCQLPAARPSCPFDAQTLAWNGKHWRCPECLRHWRTRKQIVEGESGKCPFCAYTKENFCSECGARFKTRTLSRLTCSPRCARRRKTDKQRKLRAEGFASRDKVAPGGRYQ